MSAAAMTAAGVRAALARRWPDDQCLHVYEAPSDAMRQGPKIDVLVVSLWHSKRYELDAVEIKVSMNDWQRELKNPTKSWFWRTHAHRFWVAAPEGLATRIAATAPDGWGVLSCTPSATRVLRKPEKREPDPLPWPTTVGVLRAAADCGFNALNRARGEGFRAGVAHASAATASTDDQRSLFGASA